MSPMMLVWPRTCRPTGGAAPEPARQSCPPTVGTMTPPRQNPTDPSDAPDLSTISMVQVGAGNMGGAFVRAARAAGITREHLRIVNSSEESARRAAEELDASAGSLDDVAGADVVVIGVKPYQLDDMLPQLASRISEDALVLCLAAGTTLDALTAGLDGHRELVRIMPNTPMAIGEGVIQLMPAPEASEKAVALARAVLSASGLVVELGEDKGDAVIAAAGSAPAFVFTVIDAMIDEAVRQGIPRPQASAMVIQTVKGSAALLESTGDHPAVARSAVMSPGGTTAEGVAALERNGLRAALAEAMAATARRSREMSEG